MAAATTVEQATIRQYCKVLRTPTIGLQFQTLADQAIREKHTYTRYLEALLAMEVEERERHAVARRIQEARLPRLKTIEDFDFSQSAVPATRIRELADGGYIGRAEPVVLIGECGTGKTHLATALCVAACRQKKRVRFTTAAALVNELVEAKHQNQLRRLLARWLRYELIAIDEVGYVPLADVGAELLFQVVSDRRTGHDHHDNQFAVLGVDASLQQCPALQSTLGSCDGPRPHLGNRSGILSIPPHTGETSDLQIEYCSLEIIDKTGDPRLTLSSERRL
jgi:DNA replication protein DnaC